MKKLFLALSFVFALGIVSANAQVKKPVAKKEPAKTEQTAMNHTGKKVTKPAAKTAAKPASKPAVKKGAKKVNKTVKTTTTAPAKTK